MDLLEIFDKRETQINDYFDHKAELMAQGFDNPFHVNERAVLKAEIAAFDFIRGVYFNSNAVKNIAARQLELQNIVDSTLEKREVTMNGKTSKRITYSRKIFYENKQRERFILVCCFAIRFIESRIEVNDEWPISHNFQRGKYAKTA